MIENLREDEPWICVRDLSFSHGRLRALHNVSFELRPGRHYIVAGPNGAGKSTLLDILANLKQPHSGTVRIANHGPDEYPPGHLARILALAPQEYRLDFSFSIREIVAMGRRPYLNRWGKLDAEDIRIVDQAINEMGLAPLASKSVLALSGGEKRRCIIARALAQTTPVLLLDEPNSGLDISRSLSIMSLARKKAEAGALVVTVCHDLNLAARYGHEFLFLKNGTLSAHGPIEEVFTGQILSELYEAGARVGLDDFTHSPTVSFKLREPEKSES